MALPVSAPSVLPTQPIGVQAASPQVTKPPASRMKEFQQGSASGHPGGMQTIVLNALPKAPKVP